MRVFLDTNVLASGLATRGLCSDVVRTTLELHELVVSERMLGELDRVLRTKFRVPEDVIADALRMLKQDAIVGEEQPMMKVAIPDADDIPILSAAGNAGAEFFVSGDSEVLAIKTLGAMKIVSPRAFWEGIRKG